MRLTQNLNKDVGVWPDFMPGPPDDPEKLITILLFLLLLGVVFGATAFIISLI